MARRVSTRFRVITASGVFAVALASTGIAGAQTPDSGETGPNEVTTTTTSTTVLTTTTAPADVRGVEVERQPLVEDQAEVLGETVEAGGLAATGADLVGLAALATGAVGAGAFMLSSRRKRD